MAPPSCQPRLGARSSSVPSKHCRDELAEYTHGARQGPPGAPAASPALSRLHGGAADDAHGRGSWAGRVPWGCAPWGHPRCHTLPSRGTTGPDSFGPPRQRGDRDSRAGKGDRRDISALWCPRGVTGPTPGLSAALPCHHLLLHTPGGLGWCPGSLRGCGCSVPPPDVRGCSICLSPAPQGRSLVPVPPGVTERDSNTQQPLSWVPWGPPQCWGCLRRAPL